MHHTVPYILNATKQPVEAVVRPTFIWKLSYKLQGTLKFTIIQTFDQNFVFTEWCHVDGHVCTFFLRHSVSTAALKAAMCPSSSRCLSDTTDDGQQLGRCLPSLGLNITTRHVTY